MCLAYDLDPYQFYACQSKWPEDADDVAVAHLEQDAQTEGPERLRQFHNGPFVFRYSNTSDLPICRALGMAKMQQMTRWGISPFAVRPHASEKWHPADGAEQEACCVQGHCEAKMPRVLSEIPAPRHVPPLEPKLPKTDGFASADVPVVAGRPLLGGKRVLPADGCPVKRLQLGPA